MLQEQEVRAIKDNIVETYKNMDYKTATVIHPLINLLDTILEQEMTYNNKDLLLLKEKDNE